ncbi:MAG: hypothetical protein LBI30_01400 [Holosporales bacterium]|nr:hypothetical protein [Holosporales bacterium]
MRAQANVGGGGETVRQEGFDDRTVYYDGNSALFVCDEYDFCKLLSETRG